VAAVKSRTGRVLGVDLGSKRIGLALSDPGRIVASPHDVLQRGRDRTEDHRAIVAIARDADVTTIVVGLPLSLSGAYGPAARAVREEVEELRSSAGAGLEVLLHDERLTTVTAEAALRQGRLRRDERRHIVDKVAAAVMLQAWLESGDR
jgi:putative holliday junction resolvase